MTIGILGGGLAGCVLGKLFDEEGWDFEILEACVEPGGLLRTAMKDGYTFDTGGPHILFTKDCEEGLNVLLSAIKGNISRRRRNTKILFHGRYVKYPFENGLSNLGFKDNLSCLTGFTAARLKAKMYGTRRAGNLSDWCLQNFGRGIAERYLLPYNEKIWKYPLEKISTSWVERIPSPPWRDVLKSSLGIETEGYEHQLSFSYPQRGGIQAVIEGLISEFRERVVTGFEVKSVAKNESEFAVSDGVETKRYSLLISTLPLPTLPSIMHLPEEIALAAESLHVNSVVCVFLGGVEPVMEGLTWLYIPDKRVLPHRVSYLSSSSSEMAPPGKTSLVADITCHYGDAIWCSSDEKIIKRTAQELAEIGVLHSPAFETAMVSRNRFAYVIDDMERAENVSKVRAFLGREGILTLGRFSEFEYLNMDAVAQRALEFRDRHRVALSSVR